MEKEKGDGKGRGLNKVTVCIMSMYQLPTTSVIVQMCTTKKF